MSLQPSRRQFLRQSAAFGAAMWVSTSSPVWTQARSSVESIRWACIGVDGKGASDRDDAGRHGEIVALCDVDSERLEKAGARYPKARKFTDYRKLFDEMGGDFDAVTISTPDHSHAPAAVRALRLGKHCFCQNPLAYSVAETRLLRELARKMGVCTQMGNQGTASTGLREAVEVIRRGDLGQISEVHVWTDRPVTPQGQTRPQSADPVPPTLNWDAFLGPAPQRPYNKDAYHPFNWRGWIDFGTGALGDMGCHTANMACMALQLFDPISVEASPDPEWTAEIRTESYPKSSTITFEFAARGALAPCRLVWYDGRRRPPESLYPGVKPGAAGSLVLGEKGAIYSDNDYHSSYMLLPKEKWIGHVRPESLQSPGHFAEFAMAIRERKPELALSNFESAGRLTETLLLGNVALRAGKKILWDAAGMKVTNDEAANRLLTREYRSGWGLS